MKYFFSLLLISVFCSSVDASNLLISSSNQFCQKDTLVPKVFIIGEHESQYERLMTTHSTLLLTACDDDMNVAFEKWKGMLVAMEDHSEEVNYDLKGIKLWLNLFWDEDGTIEHITYYLKPNSRNVDTDKLSLFFISFINNYRFPLVVGEKFSHYGMATFPTFARRAQPKSSSERSTPLVKDSTRSPNNNK